MDEKIASIMVDHTVEILATQLLLTALLSAVVERGLLSQEAINDVFATARERFRQDVPPGASPELVARVESRLSLTKAGQH